MSEPNPYRNTRMYNLGDALEFLHSSGAWKVRTIRERDLIDRHAMQTQAAGLVDAQAHPAISTAWQQGPDKWLSLLASEARGWHKILRKTTGPTPGSSPDYHEHRRENALRVKARIRRMVRRYFGVKVRMWSLTFAENITDPAESDRCWRIFARRLRKRFPTPYIAAREAQQRGAIHYHMLVNRYIPIAIMRELWTWGFVFASSPWSKRRQKGGNAQVVSSKRAAAYIGKYIVKGVDDAALIDPDTADEELTPAQVTLRALVGRHLYLRSQGLYMEHRDARMTVEEIRSELALLESHGWKVVDSWRVNNGDLYLRGWTVDAPKQARQPRKGAA